MKTRSIRSKTTANRYCANSPMCNHLSARHHAAGVSFLAEAHILAFRHEIVVNYVFPLIRILAKRCSVVCEQPTILVICPCAHTLMRHINQIAEVTLVHHLCFHTKRKSKC